LCLETHPTNRRWLIVRCCAAQFRLDWLRHPQILVSTTDWFRRSVALLSRRHPQSSWSKPDSEMLM
jgi:hypothetical protein